MKLSLPDIIVLAVFFVSQVAIGLYVGRKNASTSQYFLAGKSFSGWMIGISFIGSIVSSVTFMAMPADAFKTAWLRLVPNIAFPIATFLAAWLLIPFFRRGTITSAYHYLDLRFGRSLSAYASVVFIITQLVRTSMIAYLLSLLVGEITGWGFTNSLLLVVGITAIYTVKGGIKAVIWTDVIQTVILLIGGIACIVVAVTNIPGGLATIFTDGAAHHKFSLWDLDLATNQMVPTPWFGGFSEKTILMIFLVGLMQFINIQFDQSTVQRWCSAKTARDARKSMVILGFGCIPIWASFQFLGICLFVFFLHHPDPMAAAALNGAEKAETIMPYFIMHYLPTGIIGVVIAATFAAAMSTLSACINVSSMVGVNDLYKKYVNPKASETRSLFLGKLFSFITATLMIGGALLVHAMDAITLADLMLAAGVVFTVGVPSIFIAGMFTRRIDTVAVWIGLVCGIVSTLWVILSNAGYMPEALALCMPTYYISVIGGILALCVAFVMSFFFKAKPRDLTNLTVWDQTGKALE